MKYLILFIFIWSLNAQADPAPEPSPDVSLLPACIFISQNPGKAKFVAVIKQLCK